MIIIDRKSLLKLYDDLETEQVEPVCVMDSMIEDEENEEIIVAKIFKVEEEFLKSHLDVKGGGIYLVGVDEVINRFGNVIDVEATETEEEAFEFAMNSLHRDLDFNAYNIDCCGNKAFEEAKSKHWFKSEKSMVKVRLTYATGSDEEQQVLDVLKENFNILKVSKEYQGRNGSKFSNIYIDVEVEKGAK